MHSLEIFKTMLEMPQMALYLLLSSKTHIHKQQPSKHCTPIRSRDDEEPNITRRRRRQPWKQRSPSSRTLLGIKIVTRLHDIWSPHRSSTAPKASTPIRSRDDEKPNFTRRRALHPLKHPSHNSRTLSGMITSLTSVPLKQETPIRSRDDESPNVTRRRLLHPLKHPSHSSRTLSGILIATKAHDIWSPR